MAFRLNQSPFRARLSVVMRTVICSALCSGRAQQVFASLQVFGREDDLVCAGAVERTRTSTPCERYHLKVVRLPIPPRPHAMGGCTSSKLGRPSQGALV